MPSTPPDPARHEPAGPDAVALYTTIFLHHAPPGDRSQRRWLLLRRSDAKRFAPGRWTGLGGRVEPGEFGALRASALRELREETGLDAGDLAAPLRLRRVLHHDRPGEPLTTLLYYTAPLSRPVLPPCDEGTLHWCPSEAFGDLDVIETTAHALERLVGDVAEDPGGRRPPALGWAHYPPRERGDGAKPSLPRVRWSDAPGG